MEFHVITLFPEMFESPFRGGMIGRAVKQGLIAIKAHPLREHGLGNYRQVDDAPYGGGSGMVMRPEPISAAIDAVDAARPGLWRVLMTPQGEVFDNSMARDLAKRAHGLMIVAGRYEGIDERVRSLVDVIDLRPLNVHSTDQHCVGPAELAFFCQPHVLIDEPYFPVIWDIRSNQ